MPLFEPTVATAALLLTHETPPEVLLASVVVLPSQTDAVPVIADGNGFVVIEIVR
jgi:hypothetical protein